MSHDPLDPSTARPAPVGIAAPGWYPDRAVPGTERWWDGSAWGAQTRPLDGLARPLPPTVLRNTPATVGLVLGAVSLLVNTFLVTTLAAFVLCALGLVRAGRLTAAGYAPVGRTQAVVGLVLACVGAGGTVVLKGLML